VEVNLSDSKHCHRARRLSRIAEPRFLVERGTNWMKVGLFTGSAREHETNMMRVERELNAKPPASQRLYFLVIVSDAENFLQSDLV
jgi:hypothetical protein